MPRFPERWEAGFLRCALERRLEDLPSERCLQSTEDGICQRVRKVDAAGKKSDGFRWHGFLMVFDVSFRGYFEKIGVDLP